MSEGGIAACLQELHPSCPSMVHKEEPLHSLLTKSPLRVEKSPDTMLPSLLHTWSDAKSNGMNRQRNSTAGAEKRKRHFRSAPYSTSRPRQNLFMEGFQDCAAEVVRYLKEVEQIEDTNPLLCELESHLQQVSQVICQETIEGVDSESDSQHDTPRIDSSLSGSESQSSACSYHSSTSQQLNSPTFSVFTRSSESDTSLCGCESSSPQRLTPEPLQNDSQNVHFSVPTNTSFSSTSNSSHLNTISSVSHIRSPDNTFSPTVCDQRGGLQGCVVPSGQLASLAISHQQEQLSIPSGSQGTLEKISEPQQACVQYDFDTNTSSLPNTNIVSLLTSSTNHSQNSALLSHSIQFAPQISSLSANTSLDNYATNTQPSSSAPLQHISSILELKPNFLPGIDSSSLASGNFADILLGIESCQTHHEPKVQALADELIRLIYNNDSDDESDDDSDNTDDVDNVQDDDHQDVDSDSGIDQVEDNNRSDLSVQDIDWANPEDMIEQ